MSFNKSFFLALVYTVFFFESLCYVTLNSYRSWEQNIHSVVTVAMKSNSMIKYTTCVYTWFIHLAPGVRSQIFDLLLSGITKCAQEHEAYHQKLFLK